jgi:sugar phosphate permease
LTYLVSGWAAETFGWRFALFVPAALLIAAGFFMLFFLKDSPDTDAVSEPATIAPLPLEPARQEQGGFLENLWITLGNPSLWLLGFALGLLNACRYGFLDWGPKHLVDTQETGIGSATFKYAILPLGAVAGVYLAGLATDRLFGGRRAPVICLLLFALSALALGYSQMAQRGGFAIIGFLLLIGFCIYGPQVLLVGTAPADLARRGTAAAAAGFVNFLGYMGAAAGDVVTGRVLDDLEQKREAVLEETGGDLAMAKALEAEDWKVVISIWAAFALAAALATALLWNRTAHEER